MAEAAFKLKCVTAACREALIVKMFWAVQATSGGLGDGGGGEGDGGGDEGDGGGGLGEGVGGEGDSGDGDGGEDGGGDGNAVPPLHTAR